MEISHKQQCNWFCFGKSAVGPFSERFSVDLGTFIRFGCQVEPHRIRTVSATPQQQQQQLILGTLPLNFKSISPEHQSNSSGTDSSLTAAAQNNSLTAAVHQQQRTLQCRLMRSFAQGERLCFLFPPVSKSDTPPGFQVNHIPKGNLVPLYICANIYFVICLRVAHGKFLIGLRVPPLCPGNVRTVVA